MWTGMRIILLLAGLCCTSAVTPIEKVVQLLKDLQGKVETQGAKEAAQYDRYACFCKNQAKFKKKSIEKSEELIKVLEADISDLEAKIEANNADILQLGIDIDKLKEDIKTATETREGEHEIYLGKAKDLNDAIASCGEAIEALKASKKEMAGGVGGHAKVDLAQLKTAALNVKAGVNPDALMEAVSLMKKAKEAAEGTRKRGAPAFEYQSNDIIATIEGLEDTFKENKVELDNDEHALKATFDKKVLGYNNQVTFKSKEKKEKETLVEEQTGEKEDAEKNKDEATANKESDESFVTELTSSCEQKAKDWDQRSAARGDEITALAEAERTLAQGALKQYSSNKKLVGLVNKAFSAPVKVAAPVAKPAEKTAPKQAETKKAAAPSFLQIRNDGTAQVAAIHRLLSSLDSSAARLKSPMLAAIAMKVQMQEDHFKNVRALITDLITKLEADAQAESDTKGFCDTHMSKAIGDRDDAALDVEKQNGIIEKQSSIAAAKAKEIKTLSEEIAELNKALLDAEELRKEEKANNEETVAEAKAGTEAVKSALKTLKGFYGLVQTEVAYKPPKSDRYGDTVADAAPESFSGEYKGLGGESGGIMGILEVIQSDFERTVTETEKTEAKAVTDHEDYVKKSNDDIKEKNTDKETAASDMETAEGLVVAAKDDLFDAETNHENAEGELDKLSTLCVKGEETYEERVAKRQEEIAALKEAYKILDDWKN